MAEPTSERPDFVEAGQAALARGAWREAIERFEASLEASESAEAHEGRALAAWWLEDAEVVFESRHAALPPLPGEWRRAVRRRVAMKCAASYGELKGDIAVSRGWLQRAERLLWDCR